MGFEVRVLGALEVVDCGGQPVALRPFERRVLAAAAFEPDRGVSLERLEALVWAEPPATARKALQTHVARIRRAAAADLLVTLGSGYRLGDDVTVDRLRVEQVAEATAGSPRRSDLAHRLTTLRDGLACWRGVPYADLGDAPQVRTAREQLAELRRALEERLAECRLLVGELDGAVVELERLVAEEPYRERRWWLLMLALYRAGRRRDALAAFGRARTTLGEGVGLEPGDDLVRLERRLVADDPGLLAASVFDSAAEPLRHEPSPATAFVGRHAELDRIDAHVQRAHEATSGLLVVEGASGIGKSALGRVAATRAAAAGTTVAWTSCDEEPVRPLQPFEDVVAALVRDLGVGRVIALAGPHASALAPLLPGAGGEVAATVGMGAALRHLLVAAAAVRPLLVVIDDVQWAPPSTRRFIAELPDAGSAIAVLVLTRPSPGWATWADDQRLVLDPLGREETGCLVRDVLRAGEVDAEVVDGLWRRSGGHPLLVRELTSALVAQGSLRADDGAWVLDEADGVPDSVADLVQGRVAELGPASVRVLEAAAVLGPTFDPTLLDGLVPEAAAGLRDGVRAGLLVDADEPDRLAFAHALTHAAVLDALPAGRRIELHEEAGRILAARPDAEPLEVATHLVAAAPLDLDRAVAAARAAGRAASAAFAHDLAADQHRSALRLLEQAGRAETVEACDELIAIGDAERHGGDERCRDDLQEAARIAEALGDGDRLAAAAWSLIQLGPTTRAGSTDDVAVRIAAKALALATDPELRARVGAAASLLHSMTDDPDRCRTLYGEAAAVAHEIGGDRLLGDVLPYAFLALGGPEDLEARIVAADELDAVSLRLDDPATRFEALHLRFSVLLLQGEAGLDDALAEMEALAAVLGEPSRRWAVGYQRAALLLLRGDPDASEGAAGDALVAAEDALGDRAVAAYGVHLLATRAAQGRLDELAPLIDQVLVDQPGLAAWHAARAWVAAAEGDAERARAEHDLVAADGFAALPRDFTWLASVHSLAMAAATVGDGPRAEAAFASLLPFSGRMTWTGTTAFGPVDQALAEAALAAGDLEAAGRHARRAAQLARRAGAPLHLLAALRAQGGAGAAE